MFIVDSHQKVLSAWAEFRCEIEKAPRLITLDHHTDTSKPFRKILGGDEALRNSWLSSINYRNSDSVNDAITKLSNDEHIVTAIKTDIISSAFVIAHNAMDTDIATYKEHKIMCRGIERKDFHRIIETSFLIEKISGFNQLLEKASEAPLLSKPYILDIDLDYFNSFTSLAPEDSSLFRDLANKAAMITVATEPEYVKSGALDPDLTSENILSRIQELIVRKTPELSSKSMRTPCSISK